MRSLLATTLVLFLAAAATGAEEVRIATEDGRRLRAVYHTPEGGRGRAAVLAVHGFLEDASSFDPAVEALNARGIAVLAVDLRGHGGSRGRDEDREAVLAREGAVFAAMKKDVRAALVWLASRGHDSSRTGLLGASLGGSLAIEVAGEDPILPGVVALSPPASYPGLTPREKARRFGDRPVLVVCDEREEKEGPGHLAGCFPGPRAELRIRPFPRCHGSSLLVRDEDLREEIADWFEQLLAPEVVLDGVLSPAEASRAEVRPFGESGSLLVRRLPNHVWFAARGPGATALVLTLGSREYRFDAKGVARAGAGGFLPLPEGSVRAVGEDAVEVLLPLGGFGLSRGTEIRVTASLVTAEGVAGRVEGVRIYYAKASPPRGD